MTTDIAPLEALPEAPDPNLQQLKASNPHQIVWVSASAGSGKTTVLTSRVLRLMLPDVNGQYEGTPPQCLLCITYTKAAAAEMALRVQKKLSDWAIIPENELVQQLSNLTGSTPDARMIAAARRLFAEVLEAPGGLKFLTIHSFCQSVLSRFPFEAGIAPGFSVLDDIQAKEIFASALEEVLIESQLTHEGDLAVAFRYLAPFLQLDDLRDNIRAVLRDPENLKKNLIKSQTLNSLIAELKVALGIELGATHETLTKSFVAATPFSDLHKAADALSTATKTLQKNASKILEWLNLNEANKSFKLNIYSEALLTDTGKPRALGKFVDKDAVSAQVIEAEVERMMRYRESIKCLEQIKTTAALMVLSHAVLLSYEKRKILAGSMDYDDLITKTDHLLENSSGKWVHYKLDGGIDHILMDEAQDTNPKQWNIMKNLSSEIFDNQSFSDQRLRTVFIVGDEKQSIFSFQGADPVSFDKMRDYFEDRSKEANREFTKVPLEVSFRTSPPILSLVDNVFSTLSLRKQIGIPPEKGLHHYSRRNKEAGLIEIWPLYTKPEKAASLQWELPLGRNNNPGPGNIMAEQIAQEIWGWLQKKEELPSQGRPVEPGDILILVRTRNALVRDLLRQLKRRNIPVSGIDRLILSDQIGVQDLLALSRFTRLPLDDFALACVLRSPLVDLSENELMQLAIERKGASLWDVLQMRGSPELVNWLKDLITCSNGAAPFEFFEKALNEKCPADPEGSGWRAMTARLGEDTIDPLEELMSLCLRLEERGLRTLESLIVWQQRTPVEIKREMEEAGNQIRIMTVHASKGLEAPIVILPDTTSVPLRNTTERFIWPEKSGLHVPLWSPNTAGECELYAAARDRLYDAQKAEYARLLYVALTRARDRLYVMGVEPSKAQMPNTWYAHIERGFLEIEGVETLDNGRRRWSTGQHSTPEGRRLPAVQTLPPETPAWLFSDAPMERVLVRPFAPSAEGALPSPARSALNLKEPHRFRRGVLTHKLLQILPDIPKKMWEEAANQYIAKAGHDLPESVRQEIVGETLTILREPDFEAVFGPGSLAEVPITGRLSDGRIINGQIDRLVILENSILIVDYKTNRPAPRTVKEVPLIYLNQLRSYREALALIYPNYLIKCALLWTDQPLLMPVPI